MIRKNTVATLRCDISDIADHPLRQGDTLVYLHGDYDNLFPPLEKVLEGCSIGDVVTLDLPPEDAYGEYDMALVRVEPRACLPEQAQLGGVVSGGELPQYEGEDVAYRIIDLDDERAVLDGNHPLAGKTLRVRCTVLDVRAATQAEIELGRPVEDK